MEELEQLGMEARAIRTRLLELAEDVLEDEVESTRAEAAATVLAGALAALDSEAYCLTAQTDRKREKGVVG